MNEQLTHQIVNHVCANLKIVKSDFVDKKSLSMICDDFLLPEVISFEDDNFEVVQNYLWGCQFYIENKSLKILVCDTSVDKEVQEFCVVIHLDGSPTYGLYLDLNDEEIRNSLIAVSMTGQDWNKASTYLEATFLAAMEQIKDYIIFPTVCQKYREEYKSILSFLEFYNNLN